MKNPHIFTYSIVAYSPKEESWGVAVASKFLSVGAFVPSAKAGVGAIATQADCNLLYGPEGLKLLEQGKSAQEVLDELLRNDTNTDERQVGIVDKNGNVVSFTGEKCFSYAGSIVGKHYAIQGNILVGEQTLNDMKQAYESSEGDLAHRMYTALLAGDKTGGDKRGKQSACLLVVREKGSYGGYTDRYVDLRVDDHENPVEELGRLLALHDVFLGHTSQEERIKIEGELLKEFQRVMRILHFYTGEQTGVWDESTQKAFDTFTGMENLEDRVDAKNGFIDPPALDYLKNKFFKQNASILAK